MSEYVDYFAKENAFTDKQDELALKQQFIYDAVSELVEWAITATHACYPPDTENTADSDVWTGPSEDLIRSKAWEILATIL